MKKAYVAVALCSLIAGGMVGSYIERIRCAHTIGNMIVSDEFGRAADAYTTLNELRSGNTNAIFDNLEEELDIRVVSLSAIVKENPSIEHAKNYQNFLRRVAGYRAKYPHHNDDTNMDSMVTTALTKAAKENASK
jgi:hypothetical protein